MGNFKRGKMQKHRDSDNWGAPRPAPDESKEGRYPAKKRRPPRRDRAKGLYIVGEAHVGVMPDNYGKYFFVKPLSGHGGMLGRYLIAEHGPKEGMTYAEAEDLVKRLESGGSP